MRRRLSRVSFRPLWTRRLTYPTAAIAAAAAVQDDDNNDADDDAYFLLLPAISLCRQLITFIAAISSVR